MYTDEVYDSLSDADDVLTKMMGLIFTKGKKFAAQCEYRFAILNGGVDKETVVLPISGMMRDSLNPTERGLVRTAPSWSATAGTDDSEMTSKSDATPKLVSKRSTRTDRLKTVEDRRWETRTPEGQIISSEGERQERILENIVTHNSGMDDEESLATERMEKVDEEAALDRSGQLHEQQNGERDSAFSEEGAVQEIAQEEREWGGGPQREDDWTIPVHSGTGRVYKSLQDALSDPAFPTGIAGRSWQEEASSPEELAKTYGAFEVLSHKISDLRVEFRQDAASAGWHAIYCIRNICARFGDIVESIWIERNRFVVIRLKDSRELKATGRIVVSPSGAYAYCLRVSNSETLGSGGENWGTMFFPMGTVIESLETHGWPAKE